MRLLKAESLSLSLSLSPSPPRGARFARPFARLSTWSRIILASSRFAGGDEAATGPATRLVNRADLTPNRVPLSRSASTRSEEVVLLEECGEIRTFYDLAAKETVIRDDRGPTNAAIVKCTSDRH